MNHHNRDDGAAGLIVAILVLIVVIGVGATFFGIKRYRSAIMEAERARMEAVYAEAQYQRTLEALDDQENEKNTEN